MTTMLHAIASVSRPYANFILATIRVVLFGALVFCNSSTRPTLTDAQRDLLRTVPKDVRTALKTLNVTPEYVRYACCPTCFQIYPPDETRPDDPYPHRCSFKETEHDVCDTPLVVPRERATPRNAGGARHIAYVPVKPYPYRPLKSWLARLFSRPEIEQLLENSWQRCAPPSSKWTDIFHAPAIRDFLGPDGQSFSVEPPGTTNLVFSLFVDWFNPFSNKKAGKSHSIGAIYLACLNLPPHLRFRPENVYLAGIIPGPKEPSLQQLNNLMRPLVDELVDLWTRGLFLDRTALRFVGRFIRAVIIPLVCDLPALRKVAGFAGHSSKHFCSFCRLKKLQIHELDQSKWPTRTAARHREIAKEWRDAGTDHERKEIFEEHGIRWSELLRLPYWDPLRFPVVDAMHNLLLGNLRHHCMDVWGIDIKGKASSKKALPHTPEEQKANLERLVTALRNGSSSALTRLRVGYLVAVSQFNNIDPGARLVKRDYAAALLAWVSLTVHVVLHSRMLTVAHQAQTHSIDDLQLPPVLAEDTVDFHLADGPYDLSKFRILTHDIINTIRHDISATVLPSWLERPPHNFGDPSHGKLKADQWRTVCTVSLVITLVRLWGHQPSDSKEGVLLQNFIHLVTAVDLATRRSMDADQARLFRHHALEYLKGLREIFSHQLVPNHHLMLHLEACLLLFGPVHGWWGFPFERYNGLLQGLNTNNLAGKHNNQNLDNHPKERIFNSDYPSHIHGRVLFRRRTPMADG